MGTDSFAQGTWAQDVTDVQYLPCHRRPVGAGIGDDRVVAKQTAVSCTVPRCSGETVPN